MSDILEFSRYSDLPQSALDSVVSSIGMYSTVLLRGSVGGVWDQAGSGTFVRFRDHAGILTAGHVSEQFDSGSRLGMVVEQEEHLLSVPIEHTLVASEYRGQRDGALPDIAFVGLPPHVVSTVESKKKVFYNFGRRRDQICAAIHDCASGAWAVCGAAAEMAWREHSARDTGMIECFCSQVGLASVEAKPGDHGWDKLVAGVNYAACSAGTPRTFAGFSGGGLWNFLLRRMPDGSIEPTEFLLAGVAYYQSDVVDNKREIVCHGPRGVTGFLSALSPPVR